MNITTLQKANIDYEGTLDRFSQNASLYERFLQKFLEDETFHKLETALKEHDYQDLALHVHTLKGLSGNLGLQGIYNICQVWDQALKAFDNDSDEKFFNETKLNYDQTCKAIRDSQNN